MAPEGRIAVEVVYALPHEQVVVSLRVEPGTTAWEAIRRSGLLERYTAIDVAIAQIGIYGRVAGRGTVLSDADRVEIYRPLKADPKQARRRRATRAR